MFHLLIDNLNIIFIGKLRYQFVRENRMPMGGIQTIAIGDFYQLTPIPSKCTQDPGHYDFASPIWNRIFNINVHHVHQQQNEDFIKAINETARESPSRETVNLFMNLDEAEEREVRLFARRLYVHIANADCLPG